MTSTDQIDWGSVSIATTAEAVVQFEQAGSRLVDTVPLIGSSKPKISDKGNTSHQFTIGVLREHGGISAARAFMLSHAQGLQNVSQAEEKDLVFKYSAGGSVDFTLKRAALHSFQAKQKGISTLHTYTFSGEEIS